MNTIQVDIMVSFTYVDRRFVPDLSWTEISDAVAKTAMTALNAAGLHEHGTFEVSMRSEVSR